MKKLLLSLLILSSSIYAFSQGTWASRTSLPDSVRGEASGFSIGNFGYMGLGEDYTKSPQHFYKDFWQFDPSTNSWLRKADYPGKGRAWPATFVIGNYGYVVGGRDSAAGLICSNECWQYNTVTNVWTQKANFPGAAHWCACGFAIGGKGYVGLGSTFTTDFWAYDTTTNTWSAIANFAGHKRWCASGFAVSGMGYICFGQAIPDTLFKDMWQYNPIANTWTQKTSCPRDSVFGTCGFVIGNNIYVGTGQDNGAVDYVYFWKYNALADTWTKEADFVNPRCVCSAFAVADSGYFGLGWDTVSAFDYDTNSIYRFVPDKVDAIIEVSDNGFNLLAFPNPFNNFCTIVLPPNYSLPEFSLYNIFGEKVEASIHSIGTCYRLFKNQLPAGLYLLSVKVNDKIYTVKLIITN